MLRRADARATVDDLIGRHRGRIAYPACASVLAKFLSVLGVVYCAIETRHLRRGRTLAPLSGHQKFRIPRATELVSALRQSAVQFFDEVLDSDVPSKFATIGIMLMVDSQMRAETVEHLDDLGSFPFGQQINLQIEVISTIYNSTHSVLLDQHEGRQQYRLQRGD